MINVISDRSATDASPSVDSHVIGKAASRNSHKAWCMGGLLTLLTISMPATTQTLKPVEPPGTNLPAAAEMRVPDDATASLIVMQ